MTKSVHPIVPLTVLAATFLLATPTLAQTARPGEQLGMRYLTWVGKPAGTTNDGLRRAAEQAPHTQTASLAPVPIARAPGRPNRYGAPMSGSTMSGSAMSGAATPNTNGLTPASAWIGAPTARSQAPTPPQTEQPVPQAYQSPAPAPMSAPAPTAMAADASMSASAPQYDPSRSIRRQDPYYGAPPQVQAAMQPEPMPVPMPPPAPVPTAVEAAPADPMAPRRDAAIFRMARPAVSQAEQQTSQPDANAPRQLAQATPSHANGPARDGARYYSVHREAGHQPDPMILPESVFIGGGAADLAEPPPAPVVSRNINGRVQAVAANQDPTLP